MVLVDGDWGNFERSWGVLVNWSFMLLVCRANWWRSFVVRFENSFIGYTYIYY
jgi:hypothetical protein